MLVDVIKILELLLLHTEIHLFIIFLSKQSVFYDRDEITGMPEISIHLQVIIEYIHGWIVYTCSFLQNPVSLL